MSYPKPLLKKTLDSRYKKTGIPEKTRDYLSLFFNICSELYGCLSLEDAWGIYSKLIKEQDAPKINIMEFFSFANVARRDRKPYIIYTSDELWLDNNVSFDDMMLVNLDIAWYGQRTPYYSEVASLLQIQGDKPFFVPDNFIHYLETPVSTEERRLMKFFSSLKVNNRSIKSPYMGKTLKSFRFYNKMDKYLKGFYEDKSGPTADLILARIERNICNNEAEKLMRMTKYHNDLDRYSNSVRPIAEEFEELGVLLTFDQVEEMSRLLMDFTNSYRHKTNRGWTPAEIRQIYDEHPEQVPALNIGPGIKALIESGDIDQKELEEFLTQMGIDYDFS